MPLFFPVINNMAYDSPGVCDQGASMTVQYMRDWNAWLLGQAKNLDAELDGKSLRMQFEQSVVFAVDLVDGNEDCPAGIYSPAVDAGYYVFLSPLTPGKHILHIHGEFPIWDWLLDVTYNLTVVPVKLK